MTESLTFYTNPMSRGRIVRWMLEEIGEPYETVLLDYGTTMKAPEFLAVNPMGKVPALRHGDTVVTEAAAICAYLADMFPDRGLAPPPGNQRRGPYYRWLFFAAGPVEAVVTGKSLGLLAPADKKGMAGYGSYEETVAALEHAVSRGPYLCGDHFTAADVYVGSPDRVGHDVRCHRKAARLQRLCQPAAIPAGGQAGTRNRRCGHVRQAGRTAGMNGDIRARAIALYDRFTHAGASPDCPDQAMDRRAFFAELTKLAGSAAAANALLIGIAADPAAAAIVPADDKRIRTRAMTWRAAATRQMGGYLAEPARILQKLGSVLVIHENRGLNEHIRDVTRRFAVAGFRALAPDFLSGTGGTPADADAARAAIGKLNLAEAVTDGVATVAMLEAMPRANGSVGAVGFCWGGAMVNRLAVSAGDALDAGVAFYGSAPDPAEAVKVRADMLLHFAERDERVNKTGFPWSEALKAAGKKVDAIVYPGVEHAFHNDTSAERYNEAAAKRAWARTLEVLGRSLRT